MSEISRRDFIKVTTAIVGSIMGAVIGLPVIGYVLAPAFREDGKEAWIPIGKLEDIIIGTPYPFSFTRTKVNGWEKTATSHSGFILRRSEDPKDILILSSRCTHLACSVNWMDDAQVYLCPCHDAKFDKEGAVLDGPPPRPLDRYPDFKVDENGNLLIFFKEG
jgi:menaquinol-cytochrome c reductase iron-sulfur subunit